MPHSFAIRTCPHSDQSSDDHAESDSMAKAWQRVMAHRPLFATDTKNRPQGSGFDQAVS